MGYKDWETPPEFFKEMDKEFHFTYDAASSYKNTLVPSLYSTLEGTFRETWNTGPTKISDEDGLSFTWLDQVTWCNPPYDKSIPQWLYKAVECPTAVFLLPPSIDTAWFHETLWDAKSHHPRTGWELRFLPKRLKFWKDGKVGPAPRAGNLVAIHRS